MHRKVTFKHLVMSAFLLMCIPFGTERIASAQGCPAWKEFIASINPEHSSWKELYNLFIKYRGCGDGTYAEGYSDFVTRSLARHWDRLDQLAILSDTNKSFRDFVLTHIDATADRDDIALLFSNAQERCPASFIALCSVIVDAGHAALAEGVGAKFTSFAGFELGTVTLATIQKALGPAQLVETGEAGEYTASVCYRVPGGVVMFFAGEMDGPEHNLSGFGFAKKPDRNPCSKWPTALAVPDLIIGGLHLGISVSEFTRIVGVPIRMIGKKAYADFESKRTMSKEEIHRLPEELQAMVKTGEQQNYFDVVVSVVATFSNG